MDAKYTISVKPDKIRLLSLLERISEGKIKIPVFQRDFIWTNNQMMGLFDSIIKGYPIGSLLFWNPEGVRYDTKKEIGPYRIESNLNNINYILDGFQRVSTLFGVLSNPKDFGLSQTDPELKNYLISYDLKREEFTYLRSNKDNQAYIVPLYKIAESFEFVDVLREIESVTPNKNEYISLLNRAKQLNKIFLEYEIPFVEINGGDIKSAVDIFSRINSTGTDISIDYMLSALSFNPDTKFVFNESVRDFCNSLNVYNFEDLKTNTLLNCISNAKGKIYFDVKIEDLLNPDLEDFTNNSYVHIRKAVEFLYKRLNIVDIRLLPYPTQLVFISEYFRLNPYPTSVQLAGLEKWFWITTYSNYFTLYSLSQQRSAYEVFCDFALGNHTDGIYKVDNETYFSTAKYPDKLNFTGVRPKALQLFYLKSIVNGMDVQDREGIKEIFITSKKDRTPANIIFRLSSEFETDYQKKETSNFIETSPSRTLEQHFITEEMVSLFREKRIDAFISEREEFLKSRERQFVERLNIRYTNY